MERSKIITIYDRLNNFYLSHVDFRRFKRECPVQYSLLQKNRQFHNIHVGKRCFILGNGPSLKEIDLLALKDEWTFTVNEMFRHPQFLEMKPNYHFIADPYYFRLRNENPSEREVLRLLLEKGSSKDAPKFFFTMEGYDFVRRRRLDNKIDCNFFCSRLEFHAGYERRLDFAKYIPCFQIVVQWAIAMAVYMGFDEIYLLGCDATNLIIDLQTFAGGKWGEKYVFDVDKDTENIQKEVCLKRGIQVFLGDNYRSFRLFDELNQYCVRNHVGLFNCSGETLIDSIPRKRFEDII